MISSRRTNKIIGISNYRGVNYHNILEIRSTESRSFDWIMIFNCLKFEEPKLSCSRCLIIK